jgi:hypothetical protein
VQPPAPNKRTLVRWQVRSTGHDSLPRLEGYEILPTPEGFDAYTLILWTKDRRFECIADHQSLLKLAASIQTHVVPPKCLIS